VGRCFLGGGHPTRATTNHHQVVIVTVVRFVAVVRHGVRVGVRVRVCVFWFGFQRFWFHKVSAPIQGCIVTTQVFFNVGGIRNHATIAIGRLGYPDDRACGVVLSFPFVKAAPKAIVDEPFAELGAILEFVFDDSQSAGKEDGHARQTLRDAAVESACESIDTQWCCCICGVV